MNKLEAMFSCLGLTSFFLGIAITYGKSFIPESVKQVFLYGRANMSNHKPTFIKTLEVPKRWFWHFYLYAVILQLAIVITILQMYFDASKQSWLYSVLKLVGDGSVTVNYTTTVVAATLFLFHLCRRLYETLYISVYSNATKMNAAHYLLGYVHYTGAILCIVAHSSFISVSISETSIAALRYQIRLKEILGISTFYVGSYLQHRAHVGLANLRKGKDKEASRSHSIPHGELFEYLSSPNYFAEIVIYCSLAGVFGFRNSSWNWCTFWVVCNQVVAGMMNHRWYNDTFKKYPKNRKAIFPGIL